MASGIVTGNGQCTWLLGNGWGMRADSTPPGRKERLLPAHTRTFAAFFAAADDMAAVQWIYTLRAVEGRGGQSTVLQHWLIPTNAKRHLARISWQEQTRFTSQQRCGSHTASTGWCEST